MKSQRDKIGCKSEMEMGSVDKKEASRQKQCHERNQNKSKRVRIGSVQASVVLSHEIQLESDIVDNDKDNNYSPNTQNNSELKTLNVCHIGSSALRFGVSNRAAASISPATLKAAKDADFIKDNVPDISLALDHKKIERSKQKAMKTCKEKHNKEIKESN